MIKSIFARPVFINPQAYLVIPLLANLSMLEPIDFTSTNTYSFESLGKVESKIISAKDEYILHIDLYESYGSCVLGEFYIGPATIGSIDDFTITTNGYITTIEVGSGDSGNIVYPGLIAAWSAKGKTNDDEDRAILKDLTGNGHDIRLVGFGFSKMSGYGGYQYNWLTDLNIHISDDILNITHNKLKLTKSTSGWGYIASLKINSYKNKSFKLNVHYETKTGSIMFQNNDANVQLNEGINIIPIINTTSNIHFSILYGTTAEIELLPEYPDALVLDGVDDYGINEDMPILTDYTFIAKRGKNHKQSCLFTKGYGTTASAFIFEGVSFVSNTYNFGLANNVNILTDSDISWQTKNYYNGQSILFGSKLDVKGGILGKISLEDGRRFKGAFYSAYLFDRSLDEQEIKSFIRKYIDPEYLLPSEQIPTPDCYYDFSLGSNDDENRETIKDQSGNGNDAVAHSFAWSGMSGYGGYDIDFKTEYHNRLNTRVTGTLSSTKFNITSVKNTNAFLESARLETHPSYKVKVTGVSDNLYLTYQYGTGNYFHIKTEGIHTIPAVETETQYVGFKVSSVTENCNITIELLPQYEGALVLDGVDDYIALEAFDSGFKTVFMVCNSFSSGKILYDQRKDGINFKFAIYNGDGNTLAYKQRNDGETYINGVLNTTIKTNNLINKKHLITIKNNSISFSQKPIIGSNQNHTNFFANMALYKFLGFKEELTEDQIKAVIQKYNLLDGVDEIKVS